MLAGIREFMTQAISLRVYKTMVLPYFDYGDILFMCTNQDLLDDLQVAQNRCQLYNFMYRRPSDPLYLDDRNLITKGF